MPAPTLTVLLFVLAAQAGNLIGAEPAAEGIEHAMTTALAAVDPDDGIDADEARILAQAYLGAAVSGCGGVGDVRAEGEAWVWDSLVGRGARPGPQIRVARDGTSISAAGHPSVRIAAGAVVVAPAAETGDRP